MLKVKNVTKLPSVPGDLFRWKASGPLAPYIRPWSLKLRNFWDTIMVNRFLVWGRITLRSGLYRVTRRTLFQRTVLYLHPCVLLLYWASNVLYFVQWTYRYKNFHFKKRWLYNETKSMQVLKLYIFTVLYNITIIGAFEWKSPRSFSRNNPASV